MKPITTGKTQVKPTARGVRIWIEGGKVAKAGFNRNTRYTRTIEDGVIVMKVDPNGLLKTAGRDRAGKELPIIDISAESLEGFSTGQDVTVEYFRNRIVIS